ncbi:MAG: HAD hydrolase family protein [Methylacidiphilales bacterium]|nr:HAD hydrolase family protein [Candidatus Methylacidiphilales bacterium]
MYKPNLIKIIGLDCDGTLTDGKINLGKDGEQFKSFDVKDGFGIVNLIQNGKIVVFISARKSPILEYRANELGVKHCIQHASDKVLEMQKITSLYGVDFRDVCYMGDDIPDLPLITSVGLGAAPRNAHQKILEQAKWVSAFDAGNGAVRELCDFILHGI